MDGCILWEEGLYGKVQQQWSMVAAILLAAGLLDVLLKKAGAGGGPFKTGLAISQKIVENTAK